MKKTTGAIILLAVFSYLFYMTASVANIRFAIEMWGFSATITALILFAIFLIRD
jgi:hypothetical protein